MMIKRANGRIEQFSEEIEDNMDLKNPQKQPVVNSEELTNFSVPGLMEPESAE